VSFPKNHFDIVCFAIYKKKQNTRISGNGKQIRSNNWNFKQPKKLKLSFKPEKPIKQLVLKKNVSLTPTNKSQRDERIILYDAEMHLKGLINPDPFAATTTCDPFLASTMYLDEQTIDSHEMQFKKWLNALVTIPPELDSDPDQKIDLGKLFNEVRNKELKLAPTKELVCSKYYRTRLDCLRKSAIQLFTGEEMTQPLSKVALQVEKKLISIRDDRNLHLDLVLQREILQLLLCFNPLWLRLGLEVTFGEQLEMQSNADVIGLSTFIINRMFKDRYLEAKYAKAYVYSSTYAEQIKKFMLKKFLFLILFLDWWVFSRFPTNIKR
jgi:abnormal spindle-like microcephaly-associated protein